MKAIKQKKSKVDYMNLSEFQASSVWFESQSFYGNAFKISRKVIIGVFVFICVVTPFTNWAIPLLSKIIKTGITIRWS